MKRSAALYPVLLLVTGFGCARGIVENPAGDATLPAPRFIVGQDLDAIRGYLGSDCCPEPDALTAYIGLYELLNAGSNYGGLGIDATGAPVTSEQGWGSGPVSAWRTATEFGIDDIALGVYISENYHPGALRALLAGDYDGQLRQLSAFLSRVDGTAYLRIGYEFDGAWNHGLDDPALFIEVWRYIVDFLRAAGVGNAEFVWQAGTSVIDELLDAQREDVRDWYPGDAYVDWLALSWFQHPDQRQTATPRVAHASLRELADEMLAFARERHKPVMIAESTPQVFDLARLTRRNTNALFDGPAGDGLSSVTADEIWQSWYAPLFSYIEDNRDIVRGLAYINVNWDGQPMWGPPYDGNDSYWGDSRLEANPDVAARFSRAVDEWRRP